MDMWSVGCIFGELLHRMERSGSSFTPKLTIEPVFKLSPDTPRTPSMNATFAADHGLAKRVRCSSISCCSLHNHTQYCLYFESTRHVLLTNDNCMGSV
jgi:hypothetical protein